MCANRRVQLSVLNSSALFIISWNPDTQTCCWCAKLSRSETRSEFKVDQDYGLAVIWWGGAQLVSDSTRRFCLSVLGSSRVFNSFISSRWRNIWVRSRNRWCCRVSDNPETCFYDRLIVKTCIGINYGHGSNEWLTKCKLMRDIDHVPLCTDGQIIAQDALLMISYSFCSSSQYFILFYFII